MCVLLLVVSYHILSRLDICDAQNINVKKLIEARIQGKHKEVEIIFQDLNRKIKT